MQNKKIELLYIASDNNASSGAFLSMVKLCALLKHNYDVNPYIILPCNGDGAQLLKDSGLEYEIIRSEDWIIPINCSFKFYLKKLKKSLKNILAVFKIIQIIKKRKIDIIHINTIFSYVGALAALFCKKPFVWHIKEIIPNSSVFKFLFSYSLSINLINQSNGIIAVSNAVKYAYSKLQSNKICVVYEGIVPTNFNTTPRTILSNDNFKFICIGEIYKQKGHLCLMQDNAAQAEEMASKALKIHQKEKNPAGIAFSKEILAYSAWAQKNYADVIQLTFEAKNLYQQLENFSAGYENLHLMALALYEQNKLDESEKILREITSKDRHYETNFHIANAYNLLGLIYLKKKEIKRAKGLFQQSLDLEQVNNRLSGIATDYANMGLIELSVGHKEQALKTFQTALDYAQANQDDELIEIIKTHLQKLQ